MNVLVRQNRQVLFLLSKTFRSLSSHVVGLPNKAVQNNGNDYLYEKVVKDFQWKIPEYWNFAQVRLECYQNVASQKSRSQKVRSRKSRGAEVRILVDANEVNPKYRTTPL